jgi:hypothetical protein
VSDSGRVMPEDPLVFIRSCVRKRAVLWTYHVQMRLKARSIPRATILESVERAELIESYPEDKYLPSYLLLATHADEAFHILFAADVPGSNVRVITAYRPDPNEWELGFRMRRSKP